MNFDIAIIGGGLAGLSLAVALRQSGLSIAIVENRPPAQPAGWDARIYAISGANQTFLSMLGAWQRLSHARICPIEAMAVFGDRGGRLDLSAYDAGASELAHIVESSAMALELWETARRQGNVSLFCPAKPIALDRSNDISTVTLEDGRTLSANLVVAADGADSWTRKAAGQDVTFKHYGQHGLVANFRCEKPHNNTAFQWFLGGEILAYLPLPNQQISIVWSAEASHAEALLAMDETTFCDSVAHAGYYTLGALTQITTPAAFPLRLMRAKQPVMAGLVLIGDAAHAIHPLSGHGINLGFQDAQTLAHVLLTKPNHVACGDLALLRRYARQRKEQVVALQTVTDNLQRLFSDRQGLLTEPLAVLRNIGMDITNRAPVLKNALIRYALTS